MILEFILRVLGTVLNTENTTLNNVGFVAGLTVMAGLLLFGILTLFLPGAISLLAIALATAFFGFRSSTTEEYVPTKERSAYFSKQPE